MSSEPNPWDADYDPQVNGVPSNIVGVSPSCAVSGTLHDEAVETGTGTPFTVKGKKVCAIQVISTAASFTLDIESSVDGTTYVPSVAVLPDTATDQAYIASITQVGIYTFICAGKTSIQANLSAITANGGSVTVIAQAV